MIYLFTIIYIGCLFFKVFKDWNKSLLLTPISGLGFVAFLILLVPFLLNEEIYVSPTAIVGLSTLIFLFLYTPSSFKKRLKVFRVRGASEIKIFFFFIFLIHLLITFKFSFDIIKVHGVLGAFFRNRLDDYLNSDIGSGAALNTFHLLSQYVFYFFLGRLLSGRYRFLGVGVVLFYVFCISIYANTRLSVIIPVLICLSYYCYLKEIKFTKILAVALMFFSILPAYLVLANNLRHGIETFNSEVSVTKIIADQLDYNKYINELNEHYDSYEKFEYGSGWLLASLGNVVPRFIWKDKPVTSFSNRLTVDITQRDLSLHNPVRTYTIFGTGYSQFYYFGVVLETFFYLYVFSRLFYSFSSLQGGVFFAGYVACLSLIYFRGETPFIQLMLCYFTYLISGCFRNYSK
ncbi:oligosaccharide repeat unit polymerase [Marinomonas polaris DSM 16579]|uniref:Oligosaccharide repeat unit polymerase n=1 Tax=Marinomonas polaris DSM 16579 TaxID=1122206 RepID=A0A1M5MDA9_9GAMM|nr:oligosaccharide repeat unit polymerase [Marinomonas polaris]SHG75320.1 oligosaccharide repeat unit polymerase [Marinomonas polaris DSM 16579]